VIQTDPDTGVQPANSNERPPDGRADALKPFRGILIAAVLAAVCWVLLGLAASLVLQ
jgi:hypothetical protein